MNGSLAREICPLTPTLLASIEARGFGAEQFLHLKLGVGEVAGHPNQLAVPYFDGTDIVGVAVLQAQPGEGGFTKLRQLGVPDLLYNLNCLRDPDLADEPLIITEGEPSCWAALASGFRRVVGVPASRADGRRIPCLEQSEELWRDARQIVLCTYDDDTGAVLREHIWREGPEPNLPTRIIVAKSRYHSEIGRPGAIEGIWNEETARYTIVDDGGMRGQI